MNYDIILFYFLNDSAESLRIVNCQVGEHLAVDFDAGFVQVTHQLRVGEALQASSGIDTLDPQCAEVTLFVAAVTESIGQTFLPCVFGYGPHVFTSAIVTAGQLQNSLSFCSGSNMIY